jgi:SAM-dependent methyltransferase
VVTRTSPSYFERLYAEAPDPWGFETRWYEQRKYALTLASLTRPRYARAFEPGCSIGVLTELLSARVDELVAAEASPLALASARQRCKGRDGVSVLQLSVPEQWPDGNFDLVVLSELGYYFPPTELQVLIERTAASLRPDGEIVAVHWRRETDYPMTGDEVHAAIRATPGLTGVAHYEEDPFILDVLRCRE